MLDAKNMEKLSLLKAQLLEEEPKPEIVYPFITQEQRKPTTMNPPKPPEPVKQTKQKHKKKHKVKQKKPIETISQFSLLNGGQSADFRKKNRQMVASNSNIARSYYSGEGNSLYTYSGGDVRPK